MRSSPSAAAVAVLSLFVTSEAASHSPAADAGVHGVVAQDEAARRVAPRRLAARGLAAQDFAGEVAAHSFRFARAAYRGSRGWGRPAWSTDFPKADRQFLVVLRRVTGVDAYPYEHAVALEDPSLRRFPFLYAVEVGRMDLSDGEVEALRSYLLAGGFLVVDDFWGSGEWAAFERNIRRVLPDRPIVELPRDHPVFHAYYEIEEIVQVPAVNNVRGPTWERDGRVPHVRGIFGEDGRLLVVINWNTDLGDAWEWADLPEYPLGYSTFAYEMGVNFVVYAMSH